MAVLVIGISGWRLTVPALERTSLVGTEHGTPVAVWHDGELAAAEVGQVLRFRLRVREGVVRVEAAALLVPVGHAVHLEQQRLTLRRLAGSDVFESEEEYRIFPLGEYYGLPVGGEIRELRVVLRNRWGITQTVPFRLRILPESHSRRAA